MDVESLKLLENFIGYILLKENVKASSVTKYHGDIERCVIEIPQTSKARIFCSIYKSKYKENISAKEMLLYSERLHLTFSAFPIEEKIIKDTFAGLYWSFYDIETGSCLTFNTSEKKYDIRLERESIYPYIIAAVNCFSKKGLHSGGTCIILISKKPDILKSKLGMVMI